MLSLITFEIKKIIRKKRFLMAFTVLFLITAFAVGGSIHAYYKYDSISGKIKIAKASINKLEESKNSALNNGEEYKEGYFTKVIKEEKQTLAALEKIADSKISNEEKIKADIEDSLNKIRQYSQVAALKEHENKNILVKQYYLDNNKTYDYENNIDAFGRITDIIRFVSNLFLVVIISLLTVDSISGEYKPATIKLLMTKPIRRSKILLSKLLAAVVTANTVVLLMEILAFLAFTVIFRIGDPTAPVAVGTKYSSVLPSHIYEVKSLVVPILGSSVLNPQYLVILKSLLLQFLSINATVAFCLLISTLIKDSGLSTGVSVMILAASNVLHMRQIEIKTSRNFIDKTLPYWFPTYYNSSGIITGRMVEAFGNPVITFDFSIKVLVVSFFIFYAFAHVIFVKRDVL